MIAVVTSAHCAEHSNGPGHPERPARLEVALGAARSFGRDAQFHDAAPAPIEAIEAVHEPDVVARLQTLHASGGGIIDGDTSMNAASWPAALCAAGAGLGAAELLRRDPSLAGAFCLVRPPGHHATPDASMGFCLVNSVAVTAASLASAGERVAIVDFDVHHGNGTQAVFEQRSDVLFVSLHQYPWYPGSGGVHEVGSRDGAGYTINVPLLAGTTGGAYRRALAVLEPVFARFAPTWLLVSAGYDAHRLDPLAQLGLTAGDYADLVSTLRGFVPFGRVMMFLEGGYHLDALARSVRASIGGLLGSSEADEARSADCALDVEPELRRLVERYWS